MTSISSVGYCHLDYGCRIVVPKMFSANGIASTSNGTVYVSSTSGLKLVMYEKQDDGSLILQDSVLCGMNNCSHSL